MVDNMIDQENQGGEPFLSAAVRALFVEFSLYNPSLDDWIAVEIYWEFTPNMIFPSTIVSRTFDANLVESSSEQGVWASEFLRFFLSFYVLVACLIMRNKVWSLESLKKLLRLKYLQKVVIDSFIFLLIFCNFVMVLVLSNTSTQKLIDSDTYVDMIQKSSIYKAIVIIDSILILLLTFKIIHVFTIIKAVRVIVKTINLAFKQVLTYTIIIFPLLIAYSLIGMGVFGAYMEEFSTLWKSFVSVLGFIVGQCDLNTMMRYDPMWTVIYAISLTIIVIYLIVSSFSAILIDAYEYIIYKEGYPGDDGDHKWTVKDAFLWMLDVLPYAWLEKIGIITKSERRKKRDQDDGIENFEDSD
jgi:hypothetical protein